MKSKIFLLCLALTANTFMAYAQAGELDNIFGTLGKVTRPSSNANAVAIQTDGKKIAGGYIVNGGITVFAVFRYNADGTQDNTFGTNGAASTTFDLASAAVCKSIAIQTDGKIVAAGAATSTNGNGQMFVVARFNSNGTLDNNFGTNGRVETIVGLSQSGARGVALQQDGKIVLTGDEFNGDDNDVVLIRYNTNGMLDNGFGGDGIVTADWVWDDYSNGLVIQPDDKIVIAGSTSDYSDYYKVSMLIRFNADGTLDNSFGSNGFASGNFNGYEDYEQANALALQADGKIVITGNSNGIAIARFNANGSFDATFEPQIVYVGNKDWAFAIAVQSDQKIIVVGKTGTDFLVGRNFVLLRFKTDGSLDSTFGTNGIDTTDFNGHEDEAHCIALQPDGKIVVGGFTWNGTTEKLALARYLPGCITPTVSISANGSTTVCKPQSVTLNSSTTGNVTAYQWTKNGTNQSGATSSSFTAKKTGTYALLVTNACGTATSNSISVTTNVAPTVSVSPIGTVNMCSGQSTLLTANSSGNVTYQWKKGAANIAGATNQTYSATTAGKYRVIVTNASGCSKSSKATTINITCKEELAVGPQDYGLLRSSFQFAIFPNPSNDQFVIRFADDEQYDVRISDLLGRTVEQFTDVKNEFVFGKELYEGVYFVEVRVDEKIEARKIVKE